MFLMIFLACFNCTTTRAYQHDDRARSFDVYIPFIYIIYFPDVIYLYYFNIYSVLFLSFFRVPGPPVEVGVTMFIISISSVSEVQMVKSLLYVKPIISIMYFRIIYV